MDGHVGSQTRLSSGWRRYADLTMREPDVDPRAVHGLVLAAGAGTRYGQPKALVIGHDGLPWVARAVAALHDGGCQSVTVALGASAEAAVKLVPPTASVLLVHDWADGLSATLRSGLREAAASRIDAVVITPVDTPDMPASAVRRVIDAAGPQLREALIQATYDGMPGHPVLIGSAHFEDIAAELNGDIGARRALVARGVYDIECGDLWSGVDVDAPR